MNINPKDTAGLKRPANEGQEPGEKRISQRPRLREPSVETDRKPENAGQSSRLSNVDSLENTKRPGASSVSISLSGLKAPKKSGIMVKQQSVFTALGNKNISGSSSSKAKKEPSPPRGKILFSGPNPLKNPPFWKEPALREHSAKHLKDTNSQD